MLSILLLIYKWSASAGIHVYMGDLHAQKRSLWNLDLECERPFEEAYYFRWARSLDPLEQPIA